MIDVKHFFDQPVHNSMKIYENIWKIAVRQGDDYTTGCLLDYNNFNEHHKMIAIDLSEQQELDADPKAIQQINLTGSLDLDEGATFSSLLKKQKKGF